MDLRNRLKNIPFIYTYYRSFKLFKLKIANAVITYGVHIEKGAIIGASSVVTKNVKEYDVVSGIPAKKLFNRKDKN